MPFFTDGLCASALGPVCRKGSRLKFLHQAEEKAPARGSSAVTQMNSQTLSTVRARIIGLV